VGSCKETHGWQNQRTEDASEIMHLMADTVEDGIEKGYVVSYAINEKVVLTSRVLIEEAHMHPTDALHIVVAVVSGCDYFITADKDITDRIRYARLSITPVYIFDENQVLKFFADL
jgi:predicted nucleic acid-binding protein